MSGELGRKLREGYRCDCDGRDRVVRVCDVGDGDPSEQILAAIEVATGDRPDGCPWRSFRDPFVAEVLSAYRWWKARQLSTRWPDPPVALLRGIEVYDAALNAVQVHDLRKEREKRETAARERELSRQVGKHRGRRAT